MALTKMNFKILVVSSDGIQEKFIEAYQFSIGRADQAELRIPANGISRIHLIVLAKDGEIYIKDNNSSFGTQVGGKTIVKGKFVRYSQGGPIKMGKAPVILNIRMITDIETAHLLAKKDEAFVSRYIKHEAIEDINSWLSSLLKPTNIFSSIAKVNLMNWENNVKQEMNFFIKEMQELAQQTIEKAKLQGEQIIYDSNVVASDLKAAAMEEAETFLAQIDNKGSVLFDQAKEAAVKIQNEASKSKDEILKNAELKAQSLLREADERFKVISGKADQVEKTYTQEAQNKSEKILNSAKTRADNLTKEAQIRHDELISRAQNESEQMRTVARTEAEALKVKTENEANELSAKAKAEAESLVKIAKNQAFEHEQKSRAAADELLQKFKEQGLTIKNQADKEALDIIQKSRNEAHKILQNANNEKEDIIRSANNEANKIVKNGEIEKEKLIELGQLSAEKIKKEYQEQAAAIIREAHDEAEITIQESKQQAQQFIDNTKKESESLIGKALREAEELKSSAKKEISVLREKSQRDVEQMLKDAKEENIHLVNNIQDLKLQKSHIEEKMQTTQQQLEIKIQKLRNEVKELENEAKCKSKDIIEQAKTEAERIDKVAHQKVNNTIELAKVKAQKIEEQAQTAALDITNKATTQARLLEEKAQDLLKKQRDLAEKESENILQIAIKQKTKIENELVNLKSELEEVEKIKKYRQEERNILEHEVEIMKSKIDVLESEYKSQFKIRNEQNENFKKQIKEFEDQIISLQHQSKEENLIFKNEQKDKEAIIAKLNTTIQVNQEFIRKLNDEKNKTEKEWHNLQKQIQALKDKNSVWLDQIKNKEEEILSSAEKQAHQLLNEAHAQSTKLVNDSQFESQNILEATRLETINIMNEAQLKSQKIMDEAQNHYHNLMKKAETEYIEQAKLVEQELMARRLEANEELKKMLQQKGREFEQKKKMESREVLHELQEGVLPLIEQIPSLEGENKKLLFNQIKKTVKAVLDGESIEHQNRVKTLLSFNPLEAQKSRRFWYKASLASSFVVILFISYLIVPQFFAQVGYNIIASITPEAQLQEIIATKHFDRLRRLRQFNPETNDIFKDTYTDNILYTTAYLESVTDENYKRGWTLALNKFFLNKLNLHETTVAKYMGWESKTLLILEDLRLSLNASQPETLQSGIGKMHQEEKEKLEEVRVILEGEENFKKFWSFHKNYFENNNVQVRSLASDSPSESNQHLKNDSGQKKANEEAEVYSVEE